MVLPQNGNIPAAERLPFSRPNIGMQMAAGRRPPRAAEVVHDPEVVREPEAERQVFVLHAADHVLGRIQSIYECPQAAETMGTATMREGSRRQFRSHVGEGIASR